jgi:hypothetical protein
MRQLLLGEYCTAHIGNSTARRASESRLGTFATGLKLIVFDRFNPSPEGGWDAGNITGTSLD